MVADCSLLFACYVYKSIVLMSVISKSYFKLIETARELSGKIYKWHGNERLD